MATFWRTSRSMVRVGGAHCTVHTHPLSVHLPSRTCTVMVYTPAERADSLPLFLFYPYMYSVVQTTGRRLPPPPPLSVAKTGKKHLNDEITPPPHWERREILPNHIKFRTCSALAPM